MAADAGDGVVGGAANAELKGPMDIAVDLQGTTFISLSITVAWSVK